MGNLLVKIAPNSALSQDIYPPSSKFNPARDIPDLSGKIVLVTGGNVGLGYHTVKQLLLKNATVYLAARSSEKGTAAIRQLEDETCKTAIFLQLDLADLPSVRRAATEFLAKESRLDVLYNNAGLMLCPVDQFTAQDHDLPFGTTVIGHYFLTTLLLPALAASHAASGVPARIINLSSSSHKLVTDIHLPALKRGPARDTWLKAQGPFAAPWSLYGTSKLGNIVMSNYFARKHADILVSCAVNPGSIQTGLQRHMTGLVKFLVSITLAPAELGVHTQLWAGTTASPAQITGQFLFPYARIGKASPAAASSKLEIATIAYLDEQIKGF
ncbi:NAD(P)-binding protein [Mycena epipterygia]|nr:NAD(P)-binding protein [Mycena epipterygia]